MKNVKNVKNAMYQALDLSTGDLPFARESPRCQLYISAYNLARTIMPNHMRVVSLPSLEDSGVGFITAANDKLGNNQNSLTVRRKLQSGIYM